MQRYYALLCVLGLISLASQADASILYGSTAAGHPGELWIINPANGAAIQDVGPLNDSLGNNYSVTGMAYNPADGVLYGSTGGKTGTQLLTINPATARVTVVGSYNAGANTMTDLAFSPSGTLYGIGSSGAALLFSINTSTGQATQISSAVDGTLGGGLAISPGGVFYGTPLTTEFGTYDPSTGAYTHITDPARPAGANASYGSLAFDGNTLYGMDLGTPTHLVTFDALGNVTDLGPSVDGIDGIAFVPVPEPGTSAMLLGTVALFGLSRSRKRPRLVIAD